MVVEQYRPKDYPKEHSSWCKMRERCRNENHDSYYKYGGNGIEVSDTLYDSFQLFMGCLGEMPKDGQRYSIDRITSSGNYVEENIRWATQSQQAQNKNKRVNNTSGFVGVYKEPSSWAAEIWDRDSTRIRKRFSIKKYGDELALFLAQEQRSQWVVLLNQLGCHYPTEYF